MAAAHGFFSDQSFIESIRPFSKFRPETKPTSVLFVPKLWTQHNKINTYLHSSQNCSQELLAPRGTHLYFAHVFATVSGQTSPSRIHHARMVSRGEPYQRLIEDCMGLLARTVTAAGSRDLSFGGHIADRSRSLNS